MGTLPLTLGGIGSLAGGAGLGALGTAAGIAAPAVIAVAVALDGFNKSLAENKRRLDAALQAQDAYYSATQTLTTKEAQDRIAALQTQKAAQEQQLAETQNALDAGFQGVQRIVGGQVTFVGDALARIFDSQSGASDLRATAEKQQTALNATTDEMTRLTQGVESGAFAANDASAAEQRRGELVAMTAQTMLQADQLTSEQRTQKQAEIAAEIAADQALIDSGSQTSGTRSLR